MKKLFAILALLLLLVDSGCKKSPTSPPLDSSDTTSHNFVWSIDTMGIYPSDLRSVWGTDDDNVYAVGFIVYSNDPYKFTAIIHWNGTDWESMDYQEGYLLSIYGFNKDNIYAVGFWQVDNNQYSLIAHWNGQLWTTEKYQQYGRLEAVWGRNSSDLFCVGAGGLILHYDGNSWMPQQSGTTMDLYDVWGFDNSHILATGREYSTGSGILLEFNGTSWITVTQGTINPDSTTLYGTFSSIWGNSIDNLYMVGALSYEGTIDNWELSDIPYNAPGINLRGLAEMNCVRGYAGNNIFITGYYDLIIHWNGNNWHIYNQYSDKTKQSSLRGIWLTNKSVFIVGFANAISQAIVYRGNQ
jgi:hypothetical protein